MNAVFPLFAVVMPFLLWPIELIFPYPFIVEEIAKGILVYFLSDTWRLHNTDTFYSKIKIAVLIGVLFAFSESVLYIFNITLVGNINTLFLRLGLTIPLHSITTVIILTSALKDRRLIIF